MKQTKRLYALALLIPALLFSGCGGSEPDSTPPHISFQNISNRSILPNPATIAFDVSDNDVVDRVAVSLNGVFIDSLSVEHAPFEVTFDWGAIPIGDSVRVEAWAYDNAGNHATTPEITIIREWETLADDPDDAHPRNLYRAMTRSNGEYLAIRIETFGFWTDPYSLQDGIDCALFFDSDQSATTGLSAASGANYIPNDIGADYAAFVGMEGDALGTWLEADGSWGDYTAFADLVMPDNSNAFEVTLPFSALASSSQIDLVVGLFTFDGDTRQVDWLPNSGHLVVMPDDRYVGELGASSKRGPRPIDGPRMDSGFHFWR